MQHKALHKCLICGTEWQAQPSNMLFVYKYGCPLCSKESLKKNLRKSNDKYLQELKDKDIKIQPLEPYKRGHDKILHRCLICNYEWTIRPDNILHGKGCPNCAGNAKKTPEQYIKLVNEKNPNVEVLEEYKSYSCPIKHRCKKHDYIWNAYPNTVLGGGGCPLCQAEDISLRNKKTNEKYIEDLKEKNPDIIPLENYCGGKVPIKFKCLKCNNIWSTNPQNLLQGHGCPRCVSSKGEEAIERWLNEHDIHYETQKRFDECRDKKCLPFDFYIYEKNKCIEYDGEQHFKISEHFGGQEGFEIRQKHDQIKTEYCKNNNIPLLRIPYYANIDEELFNFLLN